MTLTSTFPSIRYYLYQFSVSYPPDVLSEAVQLYIYVFGGGGCTDTSNGTGISFCLRKLRLFVP